MSNRIFSIGQCLILVLVSLGVRSVAQAQSYTFGTLFTLGAGQTPPNDPLILDSAGNFWGSAGGGENLGTIFKVTKTGVATDVYEFGDSSIDGDFPTSLARDTAGNLYGVSNDGEFGDGMIFKVTPSGKFTQLHSFTAAEGFNPGESPVIVDSTGNLYGVANDGTLGGGTIFKLEPSGVFNILYEFCTLKNCADGETPNVPIRDKAGNIYGSTYFGGVTGCPACQTGNGVVYKLDNAGVLTVLHKFAGGTKDGSNPFNKLKQDSKGNLYGTTVHGGKHSAGVLFQVNATSGAETVLYNFCSSTKCKDGQFPSGPLVLDASGNIYGVASGSNRNSVIWEVTAAGKEITVYTFAQNTGAGAGLTIDSAGNLYGTYQAGSTLPAIFKLTLGK